MSNVKYEPRDKSQFEQKMDDDCLEEYISVSQCFLDNKSKPFDFARRCYEDIKNYDICKQQAQDRLIQGKLFEYKKPYVTYNERKLQAEKEQKQNNK